MTDKPDAEGSSPEFLLEFLSDHRTSSQRRRQRTHWHGNRRGRSAVLLGIVAVLGVAAIGMSIWRTSIRSQSANGAPVTTNIPSMDRTVRSKLRSRAHASPPRVGRADESNDQPRKLQSARVVLTAAQNDSWVEVRYGSATGRILFEGVVPEGQSIRVTGRRLWARFGSLGNFDLRINGRIVHPAFNGTVDAVLTASAIQRAPTQSG